MKNTIIIFVTIAIIVSLSVFNSTASPAVWDKKRSIGTSSLFSSAIFQVASTEKGSIPLPPMTTTQKNAITDFNSGLGVWDLTLGKAYTYGSSWQEYIFADIASILTNKSIDSDNNTITNIVDADIKADAGIIPSKIAMNEVGSATYDDIEGWHNTTQSAGIITGGVISDATGGEINTTDLKGIFKTTNSPIGDNVFFDLAGLSGQGLTDSAINYIAAAYGSGSPHYIVGVANVANGYTVFNLGKVYREGTEVDIVTSGLNIQDMAKRMQQHHVEEKAIHFVSGAVVSEPANLKIAASAGVMYAGLNRIVTTAIDTNAADTFEYYYNDGAWQESDQTDIDNLQYNNYGVGLATLSAPVRYGVHWVYKGTGTKTYIVYGIGNYTLSQAQAAQPLANLPPHVSEMGALRAKVIINKSSASITEIEQVAGEFSSFSPSNHNELAGIDGGAANNYYHLLSTEHAFISGANAQSLLTTASPSFTSIFNLTALGELRLQDTTGGEYVSIKSPATIGTSYSLTMPIGSGAADQILKVDGTGSLAWIDNDSGGAGGINAILLDPGFDIGVSNVTSNTGTITSEVTIKYFGDGSLKIALSAQTADVEQCVTDTEWASTNIEVSCYIKSSDSTVNLCSSDDVTSCILSTDYDGTNLWKKVITSMSVPASGKMCWRVTTDGAVTDDIYVDECVIKELEPTLVTGIEEQAYHLKQAGTSMTGSGTGVLEWNLATATIVETGTKIITPTATGGSGTKFIAQKDCTGVFMFAAYSTAANQRYDLKRYNSSDSLLETLRGQTQSASGGLPAAITVPFSMVATDYFTITAIANLDASVWDMKFTAKHVLPQSQALTQDYDWYVDANMGGANPSLGSIDVTTYSGITNGSLDLVNNTKQNNVAIACSGTEEADIGDLTCTGNESVGITFDDWVGTVWACASFGHYGSADASGTIDTYFQLVKTGNANQTIVTEGKQIKPSSPDSSGAVVTFTGNPVDVCGIFSVNGKSTLRLFYEQNTDATVNSNVILGDRATALGQRSVHWSIIPMSGTMYVSLGDVVKTPGSAPYTLIHNACFVTNSGTPTKDADSGLCDLWISGFSSVSTGYMTIDFVSNTCSLEPVCTATIENSSLVCPVLYNASSTSIDIVTKDCEAGTNSDVNFTIQCDCLK